MENFDTYKDVIQSGDVQRFSGMLEESRRTSCHPKKKSCLYDLGLYCLLYDKSTLIHLVNANGYLMYQSSGGLKLVDLANALGYIECLKEIQTAFGEEDTASIQAIEDFDLFAFIINLYKKSSGNSRLIISCLKRLAQQGYDITDRGNSGKTPLHEAVSVKADSSIIKTLIDLGSDVNSVDKFGLSAFSNTMLKASHYQNVDDLIQRVKLFLYLNQDYQQNTSVVYDAIHADNKTVCKKVASAKTETDQKINKRSLLTPLVIESGFQIIDEGLLYSVDESLKNILGEYLTKARPLKEQCRTVLRRRYPGRMIHDKIKSLTLPSSIRAFILLEHFNITPGE